MPEWVEILRERIGVLGLDRRREAEILTELANHHEDLFDEWRRRGLSEEEAVARTLAVSDWQALIREIRSVELEEVSMVQRIQRVWLPGLITGTLCWGFYWLLETSGVRPSIFWWNHNPLFLSIPWSCSLPFIGALGAYSSRRAGGKTPELVLAVLFPVIALTVLFCLGLTLRVVIEHDSVPLSDIAVELLFWVIIPGMALLVGLLPFVPKVCQLPSSAEIA
jgi:hypothetical protein